MTAITELQMIRDVYIPLITDFLEGRLEAEDYVRKYFNVAHKDPTISTDENIYRIFQDLFEDADAYTPEPDPALGAAEIDEAELRKCCQSNLLKLKQIVNANQK